jgi:hypothetical protein
MRLRLTVCLAALLLTAVQDSQNVIRVLLKRRIGL